ncbi:MAG: Hsp33 family molecular chaperone HslO [Ostreibacterium sp.]
MGNTLQKFLLSDLMIRGVFVHLDTAWQEVLARRSYATSIAELLGQATVATLLMSSHIKFNGKLTLQLQSHGDLDLLVVQSDNQLHFRSLASYKGLLGGNLSEITGEDAVIVISIEHSKGERPYQGIVTVASNSMADNLATYFNQSEQLKTLLVLRADGKQAAGLLLQVIPDSPVQDDDWIRLHHVAETLNLDELKTIDSEKLIGRIFAEDKVVVYPVAQATFNCTCSDERTLAMLLSLTVDELLEIKQSQESVTVGCDFCGKKYSHDAETISAMVANKIYPN